MGKVEWLRLFFVDTDF